MEGATGASSSRGPKRRRCDPPAVDRLSALPESLLLHILSFLRMKDVVLTSLLSRRWRHLWTSTPSLDFSWRYESLGVRVDYHSPKFIDRALILHEGTKIKTFSAAVFDPLEEPKENAEYVKKVDSWVRFALRRKVEVLELFCFVIYDPASGSFPQYTLPDCLLTSDSLVSLTLRRCKIKPCSRTSLSSLKSLTLHGVEIKDDILKWVLAGCPVLEFLALESCNKSCSLQINAKGASPRLKTLSVYDYMGRVLISAPGITTLIIDDCWWMDFDVEGLCSIVTVSLGLRYRRPCQVKLADCKRLSVLLCNLSHAKVLKLCSWCVQVLSVRASESSQLPPDFSVIGLELTVGFIPCEFPGIFFALRSFTRLEFLTVDIVCEMQRTRVNGYIPEKFHVDETNYVMSDERSSANMLQHLKMVNIFGLVRPVSAEEENKTVEEILEKYQDGFDFIRFLLRNSPVLERLTVRASQNFDESTKKNFEVLFRLSSLLLSLPRASPNALVIIQDK